MRVIFKMLLFLIFFSALSYGGYFLYKNTTYLDWLKTIVQTKEDVQAAVGGVNAEVPVSNPKNVISLTGKVKPKQETKLSFEYSGVIKDVLVNAGDRVVSGQELVKLDTRGISADLAKAEASLRYQESRLSELRAGTRPEKLAISSSKKESAKKDLDKARQLLIASLQSAYAVAEDSVQSKVDELFIDPRIARLFVFTPQITPDTNVEKDRSELSEHLYLMKKTISSLSASTTDSNLNLATKQIKGDLEKIRTFMDNFAPMVNTLKDTTIFSQATLTGWKENIYSARTNISVAIADVLSSEEKLSSAELVYSTAQGELKLDKLGAVSQQIEAQKAQVAQAKAEVESTKIALSKMTMSSPADGVVSVAELKKGEMVNVGVPSVIIIDDSSMYIEAYVAEVNISKVSVGNKAEIAFDALSDTYQTSVHFIDPAETIVNSIPTFKIKLQIDDPSRKLRSGMTAHVNIFSDSSINE